MFITYYLCYVNCERNRSLIINYQFFLYFIFLMDSVMKYILFFYYFLNFIFQSSLPSYNNNKVILLFKYLLPTPIIREPSDLSKVFASHKRDILSKTLLCNKHNTSYESPFYSFARFVAPNIA